MAEILELELVTKHDLSVEEMFSNIAKQNPYHAFVIVWPEDGTQPTYHSTTGDMPTVLMRLREFEHKYFNNEFI